METKKNEATQMPLTPGNTNPPEQVQTQSALKKRYAVPEVILPPEDKPLITGVEAKRKRREDYIRNGS